VGRVDAAANALRAHEADPSRAGAFGFDRRATRAAAAELARAADALRACGADTRARVAAAAARRGAEACRAWAEEPGCAKSLARLGGEAAGKEIDDARQETEARRRREGERRKR
jgi:hypothetical protein